MTVKLLKKEMAEKAAKMMSTDLVKGTKDTVYNSLVLQTIEDAYIAGYDLAMSECRKENSRSGEDMFHYLNELEINHKQAE